MSEPITNVADAVRELGALPVPVGPESSERGRLRAAYIEALDNAHQTHPCPVTGRPYWTGCVHYDEAGRVVGVGSCHSERRADAVLAVRDAELERLRAEVAALLAERHSTNEALDDAVRALRARRGDSAALPWAHAMSDHDLHGFLDDLVSAAMGRWQSDPEVPDRTVLANVERVCATWRTPGLGNRLDGSEFDGVKVRIAPSQVPCEVPDGEHAALVHHDYRVPRDRPELGGV